MIYNFTHMGTLKSKKDSVFERQVKLRRTKYSWVAQNGVSYSVQDGNNSFGGHTTRLSLNSIKEI